MIDESKQTAGTNSNSQSRSRKQNVREVLLEVGERLFPKKVSKELQQYKLQNAPSVTSTPSITTSMKKISSTHKSFAAMFMQSRTNGLWAGTRFLPKSEQLYVHCVASRKRGRGCETDSKNEKSGLERGIEGFRVANRESNPISREAVFP